MIVFAAIAPHGGLVFDQPDAPTRRGDGGARRRFAAARPTAVIVLTPHGLHIDDHFAVVRSRRLEGDAAQWSDSGERYEGPGDPELAADCIAELQMRRAAGARHHVRLDSGGGLDDAARLGRDDPALVHARTRSRRDAVPRTIE